MGFAFGAPAPAPTAGGAAPAPAANAPAAGGFGFGATGATPAPATAAVPGGATPAPAATAAPAAGFSFGAPAPAPAANATPPAAPAANAAAPAPAAGGAFGAPASAGSATQATPSAASTTTAATTTTAAPTPTTPQPQAMLDVPPFPSSFPNLQIHDRVSSALARWKDHDLHVAPHGADGGGGNYGGLKSFAAEELINLLRVENDAAAAAAGAAAGGLDMGEEGPVGKYLANPTGLLKFSAPDGGLRQKLQQAAAVAPNAVNAAPNMAANAPCVTLHGRRTAVTPVIAREALQLADELHLTEPQALGLYAEALRLNASSSSSSSRGGGMGGGGGGVGRGEGGMDWEGSGGAKNNRTGEGEEEEDEFLRMLIRGGKVGYETKKEKAPPPLSNQTAGNPMPQQQQAPPKEETKPPSHAIKTARRLFFRERSALLATLSDLIRHRVEAADQLASSANDVGNNREGGSSAVLVATDQLLNGGLVSHLLETVKELTGMAAQIQERLQMAARGGAAGAPVAAAPPGGGMFGASGGLFGSPAPTPPSVPPTTSTQRTDWDMEYALLGYVHLQRQSAAECLYYLAYHAQWTVEEACGLIDLIQELTNGTSGGGGLPLLDPLVKDVPSPYEEVDAAASMTPWPQQQQHPPQYGGAFGSQWHVTHSHLPQPAAKDAKEWETELVTDLWQRGQPQLLQCVSTLIMSVVCALEARHVLVNRDEHGPNRFGAGNALFPPQDGSTASAARPLHQRLDPTSSTAEAAWQRSDVWGLLLIPYALLLKNAAGGALLSPRAGSPAAAIGEMDLKGTFSKCLMVASQLKSLTFARLSLLPSLAAAAHPRGGADGAAATVTSSTTFDFYLSSLSDLAAQYVDALGATGNLPITRAEWLDEERNLAQSEYLEKEQQRQFGVWTGNVPAGPDAGPEGPRAVNVMDRPDCLEDVFALVSGVCDAYPAGARSFWHTTERPHEDDGGMSLALAPSRALQTLDLLQADNGPSLFVYLSFLAALALAEGTDGTEETNGASAVHAFLAGERTVNVAAERRMHFLWRTVVEAVRWYAEELSPAEGGDEGSKKSSKADRIRRSSSAAEVAAEASTSYYYGVDGSAGAASAEPSTGSSAGERSQSTTTASSSTSNTSSSSKAKELDAVGRSTLMAMLCLISNVAAKCSTAREFILAIQLPANDGAGSSGGGAYQDGSLEILFSLLTCPNVPPDIMGLTFSAIANLLQQPPKSSGTEGGGGSATTHARRAWELLELCQFIPIKLLSQYSSYAAGAGRPSSSFSKGNGGSASNGTLSAAFPKSMDYGMIYQLEHVESKEGSYPATEGFLFLLSTLIRVVGCPSSLGSQWRLRPGCAPYVEYVTDFVLPRATGMAKGVAPLPFAGAAEECRLTNRALEVVEAVVVRYAVPPPSRNNLTFDEVKERHRANVKVARNEMGLGSIVTEIFANAGDLDEEEMKDALQDFRNAQLPKDGMQTDNATSRDQMLEALFGNPVPLPKTPGFAILSNLLSTNRGLLYRIIQKLLSEHGGSRGVHEYSEMIHSRSLATSLFRETPPSISCAKEGTTSKAQRDHNLIDAKTYEAASSKLRQSMILPLNSLLLLSYFERGCRSDGNEFEGHGSSADDALLWRERTILLSLRILCAAAAREEAFILSLKAAGVPLSVVPTLLFKGPIHGSFAHRFVHEEKVAVSRLSQLLTNASSSVLSGRYLPMISEYLGYGSCSLPHPLGIAQSSFSIISYITQTMPHDEAVHALCGGDDAKGIGLARAFSNGLSLHASASDEKSADGAGLLESILDLILSNIQLVDSASSSTSGCPNLSIIILGLSGSTRHNCLNVILELIADASFVLDPSTSSAAMKCFEVIYRVCELGIGTGQTFTASNDIRALQLQLMAKLRNVNFWNSQIVRFLGMRGPATPSIFHEVCNSYRFGGDEEGVLRRDTDVLHSISWLLKGVAIELHYLMGQQNKLVQFHALLECLLSKQNQILLSVLMDMPLGQSSNGSIGTRLHSIGAPPGEILKASSRPMPGPSEICAGYETVDIERLLGHIKRSGQPSNESLEKAREWATAWNSFALRVCACTHISQAWSDVARIALICSPIANDAVEDELNAQQGVDFSVSTSVAMDLLCIILLRLLNPSHYDALGQYCITPNHALSATGNIETECAMPLSIVALSLTDILIESSASVQGGAPGYSIAEEDVARVCALIAGDIASCAESSENDSRSAVLSCALTHMLTFSEEAGYSLFPPNTPSSILNVYADAVVALFGLSTAPVSDTKADAYEAKRSLISLAARSGLSSLFGHLKSIEHQDSVSDLFCSKIFTLDALSASVAQLVGLIAHGDKDVTIFLQQIAMFRDGARLLARSGLMQKLTEFAMAYADEERKYLSSHTIGQSSGAGQPPLLNGHLALINALLSSPLVSSDRVALAMGSLELLKVYSGTFDRLLQMYPSSNDLVTSFVQALYLTYDALGTTSLQVDDIMLALESSVLRITYQLSAFPFPSNFLPPLPTQLVNVEKIHASQMKNIAIVGTETSWWDSVQESSQPLPQPPTGSIDVMTRQTFLSYQDGTTTPWSEGKYQHALSSAKCLEISIALLISRVHFVAKRDMPAFCIDPVAIAKGICRCSDAARAIQDRLNTLSQPETDMTKLFDASRVTTDSTGRDQQPLSHALKIERDYLIQLGSGLGQCAEKLVCLALQEARRMAGAATRNSHEWAFFIGAMTPALDHTQIETKGAGCAFGGEGAEASSSMARSLRQEMDSVRASMK